MKQIELGEMKVGPFKINIAPPVFHNNVPVENLTYFEVMVSEDRDISETKEKNIYPFYINLVEDKRINLFSDFGKFNRKISEDELFDYNAYIERKFMPYPVWKLSRQSVLNLIETCSKVKKRTMQDVKNELINNVK